MKKLLIVVLFCCVMLLTSCSLFKKATGLIDTVQGVFEDEEEVSLNQALLIVEINEKYGLINQTGDTVLQLKHNKIQRCGSYYLAEDDTSFYMYNTDGEQLFSVNNAIIPSVAAYSCPGEFRAPNTDLLFPFQSKSSNLFGFVDFSGEKILVAQFDEAYFFQNAEMGVVKKDGLYGFINADGETLTENIYSTITIPNDGAAGVKEDEYFGVLNNQGDLVVGYEYKSLGFTSYQSMYMAKGNDELYGIVNTSGNTIVSLEYDAVYLEENVSYVRVSKDDLYGLVSYDNNVVIDLEYDYMSSFNENGYAYVKKDELYGIIGVDGELLVELTYEDIDFVGDCFVGETEENQYDIINASGDVVTTITDHIYNIHNDTIITGSIASLKGLYDMNGDRVLEDEYTSITAPNKMDLNVFLLEETNEGTSTFTFVDADGIAINDEEYTGAHTFLEVGIAPVEIDGKWGYINTEGDIVISAIYDSVDEAIGHSLFWWL